MYYLQSRYYDPIVGRFVNADSPELSMLAKNILATNSYAYCDNTPINQNDASGRISAQLIARIILGILIGFCVQFISDLIAYWFLSISKKTATFKINTGDYLSSMLSWALTCVTFNKKVYEIISTLLPIAIKQVGRIFNRTFDWIDFAIDLLFALVSFVIGKGLDAKKKSQLNKFIKYAGKGNKSRNIIRIKTKRLNIKFNLLGIKLNLGMNISNFFVSCIYNYASSK